MKKSLIALTISALFLSACVNNSAPSSNASSSNTPTATAASITADELKPLSYAQPMEMVNYQDIRNLAGTGVGGSIHPTDIKTHYSIPTSLTGEGQVIAIVDAPSAGSAGSILADLNAFSKRYNLPLCTAHYQCFKQIDLSNGAATVGSNLSSWRVEVSLDAQWAHAIAPTATILLVTARSASSSDLIVAVNKAAAQPGVVAISLSFGGNEMPNQSGASYDGVLKAIQEQGIIVFAAAGDSGNLGISQSWPAVSPYVTAVGGTSIKTVAYNLPAVQTEVTWVGGGGGASYYEAMPAYQTSAFAGTPFLSLDKTKRAIPDVSYNADPVSSPVGVVVSGSWYGVGGTSAGAPQWAGIAALIAQDRVNKKMSTLQTLVKGTAGGFNGLLYQIRDKALFDITKGSDDEGHAGPGTCALCNASQGYDAATGWGVPNVAKLLKLI